MTSPTGSPADSPALSVVVPVLNEVDCLRELHRRIAAALENLDFELVVVDDGSSDGSLELAQELARGDPRVVSVCNRAGRGQTSALCSGFRTARAPWIAMLDADLQNDPADLPGMLAELERTGVDAIVGYRVERNDSWLRRVSSKIGNGVRNRLTGDRVRDTGCSLKVFRTEAIRSVALFEGMHRFLPTLLRWYGFEVREHGVSHHPRLDGVSKYGVLNRAFRGFADVLAVRWMRRRILRPAVGVHEPETERKEPQLILTPRRPPVGAPSRAERAPSEAGPRT